MNYTINYLRGFKKAVSAICLFLTSTSVIAQNHQNVNTNSGTNQQNNNTSGPNIGTNNGVVTVITNSLPLTQSNESLENKVLARFKTDSTKYKVLIFPFRQFTHYGDCTKDYGQEVFLQLSELNETDKLEISIGWLTESYSISPDFTTDSFEAFGKRLGADFILYGNYDKICEARYDSGEVCVKYIVPVYHLKQTENKETKVSDADVTKGSLIADVKGILYSVISHKYAYSDWRKYIYYSDKAIRFAKDPNQIPDFELRIFWLANYRDSDYYDLNKFKADIYRLKLPPYDTGMALRSLYSSIGEAYMSYSMYDSALFYLYRGSYTGEEFLYCGFKLNLDSFLSKTIDIWLRNIPPDTGNITSVPTKIFLRYSKAILAIRKRDYTNAILIMDSIDTFLKSVNPNAWSDMDLNKFYPPYLRLIHEAYAKIMLKDYSAGFHFLVLADSLNNFHCVNDSLPVALASLERHVNGEKKLNPATHYVSDKNDHLLNGGIYYKLKYLIYIAAGMLSEAYLTCNFYIDSVPIILNQAINKKADVWPHFPPNNILKISYEDYYNRSLLAYRYRSFDNSLKDIEQCLSMNSTFHPAIVLLCKLNKLGYGRNLIKQFHITSGKLAKEDLAFTVSDWN